MERRIIWRGLLAGAIGGLLAFLFARVLAEPQIQRAIDYEDGRDHAQEALNSAAGIAPHEHGEVFSRAVLWLAGAALFAVALYYFVGVDQGAVSVFGSDTHVHEFVHDARHFLGFPCH